MMHYAAYNLIRLQLWTEDRDTIVFSDIDFLSEYLNFGNLTF